MANSETIRKLAPPLAATLALVGAAIASVTWTGRAPVPVVEATTISVPPAPTPVEPPGPTENQAPPVQTADAMVPETNPDQGVPAWRQLGGLEPPPRRTTRGFLRHRMVHFTFDDGPHPETTPQLLDELSEQGVHATFFVVGRQLVGPQSLARRALIQRMEAEGHTVAVHTYSHRDLRQLTPEQINQDFDHVEQILEATLGYRPGLFRPPYGGRNSRSNTLLRDRGYSQVLWNLPLEGQAHSAQDIVSNFRHTLDRQDHHPRGPGGIILLHDPNRDSVEAFPLLVAELRRRNCELLSQPDEELWDLTDDLYFHLLEEDLTGEVVAQRQARVRAEAARYCAEAS